MLRSEAVRASVIVDNVFNFEKYKRLKWEFKLPNTKAIRSPNKTTWGTETKAKLLTDRERVAKVQKSKNNYRDAKPTK